MISLNQYSKNPYIHPLLVMSCLTVAYFSLYKLTLNFFTGTMFLDEIRFYEGTPPADYNFNALTYLLSKISAVFLHVHYCYSMTTTWLSAQNQKQISLSDIFFGEAHLLKKFRLIGLALIPTSCYLITLYCGIGVYFFINYLHDIHTWLAPFAIYTWLLLSTALLFIIIRWFFAIQAIVEKDITIFQAIDLSVQQVNKVGLVRYWLLSIPTVFCVLIVLTYIGYTRIIETSYTNLILWSIGLRHTW